MMGNANELVRGGKREREEDGGCCEEEVDYEPGRRVRRG